MGSRPEIQGDNLILRGQTFAQILKRSSVDLVKRIGTGTAVVGQNGDLKAGVGTFYGIQNSIEVAIDLG